MPGNDTSGREFPLRFRSTSSFGVRSSSCLRIGLTRRSQGGPPGFESDPRSPANTNSSQCTTTRCCTTRPKHGRGLGKTDAASLQGSILAPSASSLCCKYVLREPWIFSASRARSFVRWPSGTSSQGTRSRSMRRLAHTAMPSPTILYLVVQSHTAGKCYLRGNACQRKGDPSSGALQRTCLRTAWLMGSPTRSSSGRNSPTSCRSSGRRLPRPSWRHDSSLSSLRI